MFSNSFATLLALAVSLPISTSLAAWLEVKTPVHYALWYTNETYTIAWDTSKPPAKINIPKGPIYLVEDGSIKYDFPLATNVDFAKGNVGTVAPDVKTKKYQLALLGDVVTFSPEFLIIGQPE